MLLNTLEIEVIAKTYPARAKQLFGGCCPSFTALDGNLPQGTWTKLVKELDAWVISRSGKETLTDTLKSMLPKKYSKTGSDTYFDMLNVIFPLAESGDETDRKLQQIEKLVARIEKETEVSPIDTPLKPFQSTFVQSLYEQKYFLQFDKYAFAKAYFEKLEETGLGFQKPLDAIKEFETQLHPGSSGDFSRIARDINAHATGRTSKRTAYKDYPLKYHPLIDAIYELDDLAQQAEDQLQKGEKSEQFATFQKAAENYQELEQKMLAENDHNKTMEYKGQMETLVEGLDIGYKSVKASDQPLKPEDELDEFGQKKGRPKSIYAVQEALQDILAQENVPKPVQEIFRDYGTKLFKEFHESDVPKPVVDRKPFDEIREKVVTQVKDHKPIFGEKLAHPVWFDSGATLTLMMMAEHATHDEDGKELTSKSKEIYHNIIKGYALENRFDPSVLPKLTDADKKVFEAKYDDIRKEISKEIKDTPKAQPSSDNNTLKYGAAAAGVVAIVVGAMDASKKQKQSHTERVEAEREGKEPPKKKGWSFANIAAVTLGVALTGWAAYSLITRGKSGGIDQRKA